MRAAGISLGAYAAFTVGVEVLCKVVWISVATLLFVFRSRDRMALLVSFFLLTFGTATLLTNGTEALAAEHPAWWVVAKGLQVTGEVFAVLFLLTFPNGRFVPRWTPVVAVVFLLFQIPEDLRAWYDIRGPRFLDTAGVFVFFGCVRHDAGVAGLPLPPRLRAGAAPPDTVGRVRDYSRHRNPHRLIRKPLLPGPRRSRRLGAHAARGGKPDPPGHAPDPALRVRRRLPVGSVRH